MFDDLLTHFTHISQSSFGHNLLGIYLHGSLAMGCFNPKTSDIDLLLVVEKEPSNEEKLAFMQQMVLMNEEAPAKGIELSIVTPSAVNPFVYPTPFVLHFSPTHLAWFRQDPDGYVQQMKGTDPDLAAHCTIIRKCGVALYGPPVAEIFGAVPKAAYLDSIWQDIENAEEDIRRDPMYITLNLCRVLACVQEGLILSKQEGGLWGLSHLPEVHHGLIRQALDCYATDAVMAAEEASVVSFATEMLARIAAVKES